MSPLSFSPLYVLLILTICVLAAEWLGKTRMFRQFGAALIVIILTAIVANLGLLPTRDHPVYTGVFDYIAPASIFLLLLDVNLKELRKVGVPMLALFFIGAAGTTLGVLIATVFIKDGPLFDGMYAPLAGMFAGTYTGGSLNFNAVALHYEVMQKGVIFAGAIAVDNIITAFWMFFTLMIPSLFGTRRRPQKHKHVTDNKRPEQAISVMQLCVLITLTVFALWFSEWTAEMLASYGFNIPSILIITTLALVFAQIPGVASLPLKDKIGLWLIFIFLAVVGAYCDVAALGEAGQLALLLFTFVLITIFIHFLMLVLAARIFKWDWDLVAITSQANIGGSTTAMALAQSFNRHELVLPAIVIGSLGNAIGTYIGFIVAGLI